MIEDGEGRLIDLCGIMGGELSAIDEYTKNVLLFVQTYDPSKISKTSMALAQRTMAATIFEKGTDTELVGPAILQAINLFKNLREALRKKISWIFIRIPTKQKLSILIWIHLGKIGDLYFQKGCQYLFNALNLNLYGKVTLCL